MTRSEIKERVFESFRNLFPGVGEIGEETESSAIREWDSLKHIMLVSEIEKVFTIKFDVDDMLGMQSLGDIIAAVLKKSTS